MPLTSIDPAAFAIGPAFPRYRDVGSTGAYTDVGVTLDDVVMRIPTEWAAFDNITGLLTAPMGLDVLTSMGVEVEFTIAEMFGEKMALAIPGSTFTTEVHADSVTTPGSSTLSAATLAGATVLPFTSATNFSVGDYFRTEAAANAHVEFRQIVNVSTLNITVDAPMLYAHASGVAVVETTGDGRSSVTPPVVRRQPTSAYKEWSVIAESGKNHWTEIIIPRGISQTTGAEVSFADDAISGIRVTVAGRSDPDDLMGSPIWYLKQPDFPA